MSGTISIFVPDLISGLWRLRSLHRLCLYVTQLAYTCSYRTIKTYLYGVRVLHLEAGLMNPLPTFFNLERTLRGIKRVKGDVTPSPKLAVTPDMLARIIGRLDLFNPGNMAFVAAALVAFFGFFRKANVCPVKDTSNPALDLSPVRRNDFEFSSDSALVWVNLHKTKTIQFGQRILRVPLPAIPGSVLCPVTALRRLFSAVGIFRRSRLVVRGEASKSTATIGAHWYGGCLNQSA